MSNRRKPQEDTGVLKKACVLLLGSLLLYGCAYQNGQWVWQLGGLSGAVVFELPNREPGESSSLRVTFEVPLNHLEVLQARIFVPLAFTFNGFTAVGVPLSPAGTVDIDFDDDGVVDLQVTIRILDAHSAFADTNSNGTFEPATEPVLRHLQTPNFHRFTVDLPFGGDGDPATNVTFSAIRAALELFSGILTNPALEDDYLLAAFLQSVDPESDGEDDGQGDPPQSDMVAQPIRIVESFPRVTGVCLNSPGWSPLFRTLPEVASCFRVPAGARQVDPLPWSDLNEIAITFSEPVNVQSGDLQLTGVNQPSSSPTGFHYDLHTYTAHWFFSSLGGDLHTVTLADSVTDNSGHPLDGNWREHFSLWSDHSGDGLAGGDFVFRFRTLPADANQDGRVDTLDQNLVQSAVTTGIPDSNYNPLWDIDGNGLIDTLDLQLVTSELNSTAPSTGVSKLVVSNLGTGPDSFRDRLALSNSMPGLQVIVFGLQGTGPFRIEDSGLVITDSVVIDGSTQQGYPRDPDAAGPPLIGLDGGSTTSSLPGLSTGSGAGPVLIRALFFTNFPGSALSINSSDVTVAASRFGEDPLGAAGGNAVGVDLMSGNRITVGGRTAPGGNVFAHNSIGINSSPGSGDPNAPILIMGNLLRNNAIGLRVLRDYMVVFENRIAQNDQAGMDVGGSFLQVRYNSVGAHSTDSLVPDNGPGIRIRNGFLNTIGGNTIVGDEWGIVFETFFPSSNRIHANRLLLNGGGILFEESSGNEIGQNFIADSTGAGLSFRRGAVFNFSAENFFSGNAGPQVELLTSDPGSPTRSNALSGNVYHFYTVPAVRQPVDLDGDGLTPNDPDDLDEGSNDLLNFPVIDLVERLTGASSVEGSWQGKANQQIDVELFSLRLIANDRHFVEPFAAATIESDAAGHADFSVTVPRELPPGELIEGSASDSNLNSSEVGPATAASDPNTDPEITLFTVSFPSPNTEGRNFRAAAVFDDPDPNNTFSATVEWGDSTSDTVSTAPNVLREVFHAYADDGTYQVTLTVRDNQSGEDSAVGSASAVNAPPLIEPLEDQLVQLGDALGMTVRFSDLGTLDTHTGEVDWDDGNTESLSCFESPSGPPGSTLGASGTCFATHEYMAAGTFVATFTLRDDDGDSDIKTTTILVNTPPEITSASFDAPLFEGQEAILTYVVTDPDPGALVTANLDWDDGSSDSQTPTPDVSSQAAHTYRDDGTHLLRLTVNDENEGQDSFEFTITVQNLPPAADAGGPYAVGEGLTLPLMGMATDAPGDVEAGLVYEWDLNAADGTDFDNPDATGPAVVFDAVPLDGPTTVGVALRVTDRNGAHGFSTTVVEVLNRPPEVNAGGTYHGEVGIPIRLTAQATDIAGDRVEFAWDLDQDGQFDDALGSEVTVLPLDVGEFPQSVRACDDDDACAIDSALLVVENLLPPAPVSNLSVEQVGPDVTVEWTPSISPDARSYRFFVSREEQLPADPIELEVFRHDTNRDGSVDSSDDLAADLVCDAGQCRYTDTSFSEDGDYSLGVVSVDSAGNLSPLVQVSFHNDKTPPLVTDLVMSQVNSHQLQTDGSVRRDPDGEVTFRGDIDDFERFSIFGGTSVLPTDPGLLVPLDINGDGVGDENDAFDPRNECAAGECSIILPDLPDGPFYVAVAAVDRHGNTSYAFADPLTIDSTPPDLVESVSAAQQELFETDESGAIRRSRDVLIRYTAANQDETAYPIDVCGETVEAVPGEDCDGLTCSIVYDALAEDRICSVVVRARDAAGNISVPSDPVIVAVDGTPPNIATGISVSRIEDPAGSCRPIHEFSFTCSADNTSVSRYGLYRGGILVETAAASEACAGGPGTRGNLTDPQLLGAGDYSWCVTAEDEAGNRSSCSESVFDSLTEDEVVCDVADTDNDGVDDDLDRCPYDPGPAFLGGCPGVEGSSRFSYRFLDTPTGSVLDQVNLDSIVYVARSDFDSQYLRELLEGSDSAEARSALRVRIPETGIALDQGNVRLKTRAGANIVTFKGEGIPLQDYWTPEFLQAIGDEPRKLHFENRRGFLARGSETCEFDRAIVDFTVEDPDLPRVAVAVEAVLNGTCAPGQIAIGTILTLDHSDVELGLVPFSVERVRPDLYHLRSAQSGLPRSRVSAEDHLFAIDDCSHFGTWDVTRAGTQLDKAILSAVFSTSTPACSDLQWVLLQGQASAQGELEVDARHLPIEFQVIGEVREKKNSIVIASSQGSLIEGWLTPEIRQVLGRDDQSLALNGVQASFSYGPDQDGDGRGDSVCRLQDTRIEAEATCVDACDEQECPGCEADLSRFELNGSCDDGQGACSCSDLPRGKDSNLQVMVFPDQLNSRVQYFARIVNPGTPTEQVEVEYSVQSNQAWVTFKFVPSRTHFVPEDPGQ